MITIQSNYKDYKWYLIPTKQKGMYELIHSVLPYENGGGQSFGVKSFYDWIQIIGGLEGYNWLSDDKRDIDYTVSDYPGNPYDIMMKNYRKICEA